MARTAADTLPTAAGPETPALVPHGRFAGKPAIHLGRPVTMIGARTRSHLHLVSPSVSKSHAMVVNTGAGFYIRDLASRTHVHVNGQIAREAELKDGDIVGVGPFTFRFTEPGKASRRSPAPAPPAVLRAKGRNLPLPVAGRTTLFGRRATCDIPLEELDVSTTHAVIYQMNGKRYVRDLASRTGTFLNGVAIHQEPLRFGDTLRIADIEMTYVAAADAAEAELAELEDLAGTAPLAADEPLDLIFEDPGAALSAKPAARAPQAEPRPASKSSAKAPAAKAPAASKPAAKAPPAKMPVAKPQVAKPAGAERRPADRPAARFAEPSPAGNGRTSPPTSIPVSPVPMGDAIELAPPQTAGVNGDGAGASAAPRSPSMDSLAGHSHVPDLALGEDEADFGLPPFSPAPAAAETFVPFALHGEQTAPPPPQPVPPASAEPDFGLDFTDEPQPHTGAASPEATAEDLGFLDDEPLAGDALDLQPLNPLDAPEATQADFAEPPAAEGVPAAAAEKKSPVWRRLFGRKTEPQVEVAAAAELPADEPPVSELPFDESPIDESPLTPAPAADTPTPAVAEFADSEPVLEEPGGWEPDLSEAAPPELDLPATLNNAPVRDAGPVFGIDGPAIEAPGVRESGVEEAVAAKWSPTSDDASGTPTANDEELITSPVDLTSAAAAVDSGVPGRATEATGIESVGLDGTEVVDKTEPTFESALGLEPSLSADDTAPEPTGGAWAAPGEPDVLTDSMFGREVEAFQGQGLGPIVEHEAAQTQSLPPAAEDPELADDLHVASDDASFQTPDGPAMSSIAEVEAAAEHERDAEDSPAGDAGDRTGGAGNAFAFDSKVGLAPVVGWASEPDRPEPSHDALDDMFAPVAGEEETPAPAASDDTFSVPAIEEAGRRERVGEEPAIAPWAAASADVAEAAPIDRAPLDPTSGEADAETTAPVADTLPDAIDAPTVELAPEEDAGGQVQVSAEADVVEDASDPVMAVDDAGPPEAQAELEAETAAEEVSAAAGLAAADVVEPEEASYAADSEVLDAPPATRHWSGGLAEINWSKPRIPEVDVAAEDEAWAAGNESRADAQDEAGEPFLSERPFDVDPTPSDAGGEPFDAVASTQIGGDVAEPAQDTPDDEALRHSDDDEAGTGEWDQVPDDQLVLLPDDEYETDDVFGEAKPSDAEAAEARAMAAARDADEVTELEPDPTGIGAEPGTADEPFAGRAPAEQGLPVGEAGPAETADMFFGLERDTASFLGGMPLQLPPLRGPFAQGPAQLESGGPSAAAGGARLGHDAGSNDDESEPDEPELLLDLAEPAFEDFAPDEPGERSDQPGESAHEPPALSVAAALAPAEPGSPKRLAPPPARRGADLPGGVHGVAVTPPSSPFDLNLEDVPTDDIQIPPFDPGSFPAFGGSAALGHVTTAFDGLAMPPVREADVFSQTPVSAISIPAFGSPTGAPPPSRTSEARDDVGEDAGALDTGSDNDGPDGPEGLDFQDEVSADALRAPGIEPGPEPRYRLGAVISPPPGTDRRSVAAGGRRPPAYPAEPAGGRPAPARKKRWRIGKWGLFGLMLTCMLGATLAIGLGWPRLFPNSSRITAAVKFDDRLATLPQTQRNGVLDDQKTKLMNPEVRASAREILGGVAPGFLAEGGASQSQVVADARAYEKLVGTARLIDGKPVIELDHSTTDAAQDKLRVMALLEALYAVNKPMQDKAGTARKDLDTARQAMVDAKAKLDRLKQDINEGRKELDSPDLLTNRRAEVDALRQKVRELSDAWDATTARRKALLAEVRASEIATPLDPQADPERLPTLPQDDDQVVDMTRRADELAAKLAATKQQRASRTAAASKALQASLKEFEDDIAKARESTKEDESELGKYLTKAAKVQSKLREVSLGLQQQQQSDMGRLTSLKQKLQEKNEARIRDAFGGDADLQQIQEDLALKERQYNTALGNGLRDDAAALKKQVDRLKRQIGQRQDLLTTADGIAPDMRELQTFIDETLQRMQDDRARNDRRMAEMLKELAGQAPAAGSLPVEQKAFAEKLEKRQGELNKARERYAAAMEAAGAEADAEVRDTEAELGSMQAKIDERKKQVAEAARASLTQEQQRLRQVTTEKRKRELATADQEDQAAEAAYYASRTALRDASGELERLEKRAEQFDLENQERMKLEAEVQDWVAKVEQLQQERDAVVEPIPPSDDHVSVAEGTPDRRREYILGTNLVLGAVFFALVLMAPGGQRKDDDEPPFAQASEDRDDGLDNGDEADFADTNGDDVAGHQRASAGESAGRRDESFTA